MLHLLQAFLIIAVLVLQQFPVIFCQSELCPKLPEDPSHTCITVANWKEFVSSVSSNSSNDVVFCNFNIQKPTGSPALVISRPSTLICEGKCVINADPNGEASIIKLRGLAHVSMYGFLFQAYGAIFNRVSGIHVTYTTSMKQRFCNCTFRG